MTGRETRPDALKAAAQPALAKPPLTAKRRFIWLGLALVLLVLGVLALKRLRFPSDHTPEGAYMRIALAINRDRPQEFFAYLETPAQHAAYTIRDYRKREREKVLSAFPEADRDKLLKAHAREAQAPDGADVFALFARERGFITRLRRDLSGVAKVEILGERATVETARGTRYPFRRRENGIWGLTLFTAELRTEAEKAARDFSIVEKAAADYERVPHN